MEAMNLDYYLKSFDCFMFDCDGVLWNELDQTLPKAIEFIQILRQNNKQIVIVTNNSSKSRKMYKAKFDKLQFPDMKVDEIYCTALGLAQYCTQKSYKKVYHLGPEGSNEEMKDAGIQVITCQQFADKKMDSVYGFLESDVEPGIQACIVCLSLNLNLYNLCYACVSIQKGAEFIIPNEDPDVPVRNLKMPGPGAVSALVSASVGKSPYVVGKPNCYLLELAQKKLGFEKSRAIIFGDRLEQDVYAGNKFGISTCLMSTGYNRPEDINPSGDPLLIPTHQLTSFSAIVN